jgi:hypothetical protein
MKAGFARSATGAFAFGCGCLPKPETFRVCVGKGGAASIGLLDRNLPMGDSERMLNLEDFGGSGVGEEGRMDLRSAGVGDPGGEIARTCLGAGAAVLIVGAVSCLIEARIV